MRLNHAEPALRWERWTWLPAFLVVSLAAHFGLARITPDLARIPSLRMPEKVVEVALTQNPPPLKTPTANTPPKPKPKRRPAPSPKTTPRVRTRSSPPKTALPVHPQLRRVAMADPGRPPVTTTEAPGGFDAQRDNTPLPLGRSEGNKDTGLERPRALLAGAAERLSEPDLPNLAEPAMPRFEKPTRPSEDRPKSTNIPKENTEKGITAPQKGTASGNGGGTTGTNRGVPFGDALGAVVGGNPNGGGGKDGLPGGPGEGSRFGGTNGAPPPGGAVSIVYVLDSSGSMLERNKIGKAKQALRQALGSLRSGDRFNIIHFNSSIYTFSNQLLPATPENLEAAAAFVEAIRCRPDTNMSTAMEAALRMRGVGTIFLMSDGEPHGGIEDPLELRSMIRSLNKGVVIHTLALGLGERFRGMELLKAIALDNGGQYGVVNLAR